MKYKILLAALCLFSPWLHAQSKYTLSGYIKDKANSETLIGATIFVKEISNGAVTNVYGFYSLSLPAGQYTITYSYVGYQEITETIKLDQNINKDIELGPDEVQLQEVVVIGEAEEDENVTSIQMSTSKMDIQAVRKMPQLLGEIDVIRSLLLLPGVTNVGEGSSGFNVRGGNTDQNLVLLDEAPVYNSSHLFGFFSVFNADAVKDVQLYRGGIPSRYGGRLSSVLDVRQKEGNAKKFGMSGGLGIISSRLLVEGPIQKEKSSFMLAGRRSYADLFLKLSSDEQLRQNVAYFYDLNAKMNFTLSPKDKLYVAGYFGRDVFGFGDQFKFDWGNSTASVRWNHLFSEKVFANFTGFYSNYKYSLGVPTGTQAFKWISNIINSSAKADFTYFASTKHTVEFGTSAILYSFNPGKVTPESPESIFNTIAMPREHALEVAAYASDEFKVNNRLTLLYGLRYSQFFNVGARYVNQYAEGGVLEPSTLIDSVYYNSGEIIKAYGGLEPRFSANYKLDASSSIKASYNRMRQYIHLVSNTTSPSPIDIYTPAGKYVKPAIADQVALGYFKNYQNNKYEISAEVYYKRTQDMVDYKLGAELLLNRHLETELLRGKGRAYGLELMLKKAEGRFNGWVSYTLAKSEIKVPGVADYYYPTNYDKRHNLSVVGNYTFNERWEISANFVMNTGRPFSAPIGRAEFEGNTVPIYNKRNNERIPVYHRLDFSATYTPRRKEGRRFGSTWTFGAYNLYGRKNAYSVYFRQNEDDPRKTEAVKLSIIGSIIPSVTYNFKF